MSTLDPLQNAEPAADDQRAEELLLGLAEQPPPASPEEAARADELLLACARTASVLGNNLQLLPPAWLERFWAVCATHRQQLQPTLQALLQGPFAQQAAALLLPDPAAKPDPPDSGWAPGAEPPPPAPARQSPGQLELDRLVNQWNGLHTEQLDPEPVLQRLEALLNEARRGPEADQLAEAAAYRKLLVDLRQPPHRQLAALFWSPAQRNPILRQLGQALRDEERAQDREQLLTWLLGLDQAPTALLEWVELLANDEREELVRRLRAMDRGPEAARVLLRWLQLGLPHDAGRLLATLSGLKKLWKLREIEPALTAELARAAGQALLRLAAQHRQALEPGLEALEAFADLGPVLAAELARQTLESPLGPAERAELLGAWLRRLPGDEGLLQVCRWAAAHPAPEEFWAATLGPAPLPGQPRLGELLGQLYAPSGALLLSLYQHHFQSQRSRLESHMQQQRSQLAQYLEQRWQPLVAGFASLARAWQESPGLASRLAQVQAACPAPELARLCPALWEQPPQLAPASAPGQPTNGPANWSYALEQWPQWTGLPAPQPERLEAWLAEPHTAEALGELTFSWASAHLEGQAPEHDAAAFCTFLDSLVRCRPEAEQWLRHNVQDALSMLPFAHALQAQAPPPAAAEGGQACQRLDEVVASYQALVAFGQRLDHQLAGFPTALQHDLIRALGPGLDNLEQHLLPYFQFRRMLEEVWDIHAAVTRLNQQVPEEWLGQRARVAGDQQAEGPLYANTLGLCLLAEEEARWPAYVSPRPRQ